jgi:NADH-quinone oxidoreductase subunit N
VTTLIAATTIALPHVDYTAIMPELILLGGMLLIILVSALTPRQIPTEWYATGTIAVAGAALGASLVLWHDVSDHGPFVTAARAIDADGFAVFSLVLVSSVLVVAPMFASGFLRSERIVGPEYYVLALISGAGAMIMASANDLILIFLGLEILSIPLYVLAAFNRRQERSLEAAMKYFVLGAFSSAIFVYGIALTYGATGSLNLADIGGFLARNVVTSNGVLLAGLALLVVGFGFKVAAVPFHFWTPDVYEGAPSPAVGFMAAVAKIGAFGALIRVLVSTFPTLASSWQPVIWIVATLSLLLGATVAVAQTNVKRMLAYSSINHAGFILLGLQAASREGVSASLYYLFTYSFLVLGSFGVIAIVAGAGDNDHDITHYRGLARRNPLLALCFAILLLGQAGAPFTTGFFAKLYVLQASVGAHSYALAAISMASAGIAAFFYLRLVLAMYTQPAPLGVDVDASGGEFEIASAPSSGTLLTATRTEVVAPAIAVPPFVITALGICVLASVVFGIWPGPIVNFAHAASLIF